jgi:hypothetical protein
MSYNPFATLLDPAILFFFFGLFAGAVRSNLSIPPPIAKFLSLYLLMAIGFKGGVSMASAGLTWGMVAALGVALFMAFLVPAYTYWFLRSRLSAFDAAAIAATYGSVSAVTFIAAVAFLEQQGVTFGGYMAVALVLMESPSIIMAVLLANMARSRNPANTGDAAAMPSAGKILHEAFTDGAHLLLLGSLAIGFITGDAGKKVMDPFTGNILKGMLAFFLMDMGLLVASRVRELRLNAKVLAAFALVAPLVNASIAIGLAYALGLGAGDAFLLAVLSASASYIVVPAVIRYAIPEANPSLYFSMSIAMTFPFNITLGLPLYFAAVTTLWS